MKKLSFLILFAFHSTLIQAAYYETLPKGVRNFTYRHVRVTDIEGDYNNNRSLEPFDFEADINADVIYNLNISAVNTYLDGLSDQDYDDFSFGKFKTSARSSVIVNAFGMGYGITNRLTVYGYVPHYNATVEMNLERTEEGQTNVDNTTAINIENLPDVDAQIIQSLFVNYLKYQPLGTWRAQDFGDSEIGFMYRLNTHKYRGTMVILGAVAPTGKVDNPDILQDVAFGDGQWDAFLEYGGGYRIKVGISFDAWFRYTYQFPFSRTIRLPESIEGEFLTTRKGVAEIDLGERFELNLQTSFLLTPQWTLSSLYQFMYKEGDKYQSDHSDADQILGNNTEEVGHTFQLKGTYSTVTLFKKKRFFLPASFNIYGRYIFAGKNITKYARFDLEAQFFF